MKPEDIDKLFNERLGNLERMPSPDAWLRLQEQLQPQPKRNVIPMWLSYAAAVAFLLLTGTYLYLNRLQSTSPRPVAALVQPLPMPQPKDALPATAQTGKDPLVDRPATIAQHKPQPAATQASDAPPQARSTPPAPALVSLPSTPETAQTSTPKRQKPAQAAVLSPRQPERMRSIEMALNKPKPQTIQGAAPSAAELPAQAIEVVIVKSENGALLSDGGNQEEESTAAPTRKRKLVKGLLKQVKNLAAGEKVDLASLGIDNYSIAVETQIGNRKISKTINL